MYVCMCIYIYIYIYIYIGLTALECLCNETKWHVAIPRLRWIPLGVNPSVFHTMESIFSPYAGAQGFGFSLTLRVMVQVTSGSPFTRRVNSVNPQG